MPNRDSLGDRMKGYENAFRHYLPRRMPVIIRIDGKAFHTYTKGFHKPFDSILMKSMQDTAYALCTKIEGVKLAYVQSDEISLLLTNDDTLETEPWFGNNLQKLCSISASIATLAFHKAMQQHIYNFTYEFNSGDKDEYWTFLHAEYGYSKEFITSKEWDNYFYHIQTAHSNGAHFDARAFVLPKEEVTNYFIWRQQDATRNSIQMVAQYYFSHKELQGLNCNKLQDKLFTEKGINWNDFCPYQKRGVCVVKMPVFMENYFSLKYKWVIDMNIPIFTEHREYIEERLNGTSNNKD
jgi:tRNA(His) 5'-end guanylyltransferase